MARTTDRALLLTGSVIGTVASIDLYRTSWSVLDATQGVLRLAPAVCMMAFGLLTLCSIAVGLAVVVLHVLDGIEQEERFRRRMDRLDAIDVLKAHQEKRWAQFRLGDEF